MGMEIRLDGRTNGALGLLTDVVLWAGAPSEEELKGRMTLENMVPEMGENCPELKNIVVTDKSGWLAGAYADGAPDGGGGIAGRIELPLEAELRDSGANTYFCKGRAVYNIKLDAKDMPAVPCGAIAVHYEVETISVQAVSRACINYTIMLTAQAYLTRRSYVGLEACDAAGRSCAGSDGGARKLFAPTGCTLGTLAQGAARSCAQGHERKNVPVSASELPAAQETQKPIQPTGCTLGTLAQGAARSCAQGHERKNVPVSASELPAAQETQKPIQPTGCTLSTLAQGAAQHDAAQGTIESYDGDAYRTLVKIPAHRHRRI